MANDEFAEYLRRLLHRRANIEVQLQRAFLNEAPRFTMTFKERNEFYFLCDRLRRMEEAR
ncbi:uncharacterized protein G2W53_018431 [Senna tora]|uniref:Uncharacterized protein n=1 Tax=Senna tora TaxID=362788 RepID=A0A834TSJ1_9FABA|nr:uncharacterized protein G2W53_018431 [Senna tora]